MIDEYYIQNLNDYFKKIETEIYFRKLIILNNMPELNLKNFDDEKINILYKENISYTNCDIFFKILYHIFIIREIEPTINLIEYNTVSKLTKKYIDLKYYIYTELKKEIKNI